MLTLKAWSIHSQKIFQSQLAENGAHMGTYCFDFYSVSSTCRLITHNIDTVIQCNRKLLDK